MKKTKLSYGHRIDVNEGGEFASEVLVRERSHRSYPVQREAVILDTHDHVRLARSVRPRPEDRMQIDLQLSDSEFLLCVSVHDELN
jgi:hypothetical protein